MMNKDIPVGSRVFLSEETEWDIGFTNPVGIEGVVSAVKPSGYIRVNWSNGSVNAYRPEDSDLIVVEGKS